MWAFALLAVIPLILGMLKGIFSISIFVAIAVAVNALAGRIINLGIIFQTVLLDPERIAAIGVIWTLTRDFINIFFILILLVIAFATIFNQPTGYRAKELLPKLIIAALLINFSLVITKWVIDLLWVPANVFLGPLGTEIADKVIDALSIQTFFSSANIKLIINDLFKGAEGVAGIFMREGIFRGIILVVNAFILSWIALIIWARIPVLIGLMLVSPIAWLGLTLPAIKKNTWDAWWQKLFCWGSIPIPLFGLIYFVVYFNQGLKAWLRDTGDGTILRDNLPVLGYTFGDTLVWMITAGILFAGLFYIKGLSCSLYGLVSKGFFGTWGGIRKGVGTAVDFGYAASGYKKAVGQVQKDFKEGGIPIGKFKIPIWGKEIGGGRYFGAAQRETREARIEDQLRGASGLKPTYAAERKLSDEAVKATRDIENRLKRVATKTEEDQIINDLKQSVAAGKSDPETLAALSVLAKKGQLEKDVIEKAIQTFEKTPLAIEKVFSNWKEGKFGGAAPNEIISILQDPRLRIPIDARRNTYSFIASEDGKGIAKEMNYNQFVAGADVVKGTKDEFAYLKQFGGLRPTFVGEYKNPTDITAGTFDQIKKASFKNFAEYDEDEWNKVAFDSALRRLLADKKQANLQDARNFVVELRKKLIEEGKEEQRRKLVQIAQMQNLI